MDSQYINGNSEVQSRRSKRHRLKLMACLGVFLNYIRNAQDLEKEFQDGQNKQGNTYFRNKAGRPAFACIVPVPREVQEIRKAKIIFSKARNLIKLNINTQYLNTDKNKEDSLNFDPRPPKQPVPSQTSTLLSFKRIPSKLSIQPFQISLVPSKKVVRKKTQKRIDSGSFSVGSNLILPRSQTKNIRQPMLQFKMLGSSIQNLNQKLNFIKKFLNSKGLPAKKYNSKIFQIPIKFELTLIINCMRQITQLWLNSQKRFENLINNFFDAFQDYKLFVQDFAMQQKSRTKKPIEPRKFDKLYQTLINARLTSYIMVQKLKNVEREGRSLTRGLQRLRLLVSSKGLQELICQ